MTRGGGVTRFLVVFGLVALVIAGGLSYFADPDPDGLDAVTQRGCEVAEDESLSGECIAQDATDHALGDSPLADYTIGGDDGLTGVAGVVGVLLTFAVAGGAFWLLRRRSPTGSPPPGAATTGAATTGAATTGGATTGGTATGGATTTGGSDGRG